MHVTETEFAREREPEPAGPRPLADSPGLDLSRLQNLEAEGALPPQVIADVVDSEPVALDDDNDDGFAAAGIDPVAEARARYAGAGAALETEPGPGPGPAEDTWTSLLPKIKLAGIAAVMVAGALAVRFLSPGAAPAPVSTSPAPPARVSAPQAVVPGAGPGAAVAQDAPLPGGTEIYLTDSPTMQITADAFETEITQLANAWPASLQACDAKGLTRYDRGICIAVGQETYFRCAPDGRNYMISATCVYPS